MVVNWSMEWSMSDQLPKQGGGQLPPFRGALTARHPPPRKSPGSTAPLQPSHHCATTPMQRASDQILSDHVATRKEV